MKNCTFILAFIVSLLLAFNPANAATFTVSNPNDGATPKVKTTAVRSLVIDIAAKYSLETETTYRIPVYAKGSDTFITVDFDMSFDASKLSIEDIVLTELGASSGLNYVWNTPEEGLLQMASYAVQDMDTDQPLFEIIVKEDITGEEFGIGTSYFNGIAADIEVTVKPEERSLVLDVAAKYSLETETTYRIPVYAKGSDTFITVDFDMSFDASKLSVEDIVLTELGASYNIQHVWNTPEEGRLMMASYTIQEIDTDQPLFELIVKEDVTGEEFGAGISYFNGIASNVEVTGTAVGIEDILGGSNSLTAIQNIHPNPTNDVVTIAYSTQLTGDLQVQIMDLAGKTVAEQAVENNGKAVMNVSALQNGLYILTLSEDGLLKGRAKMMVTK